MGVCKSKNSVFQSVKTRERKLRLFSETKTKSEDDVGLEGSQADNNETANKTEENSIENANDCNFLLQPIHFLQQEEKYGDESLCRTLHTVNITPKSSEYVNRSQIKPLSVDGFGLQPQENQEHAEAADLFKYDTRNGVSSVWITQSLEYLQGWEILVHNVGVGFILKCMSDIRYLVQFQDGRVLIVSDGLRDYSSSFPHKKYDENSNVRVVFLHHLG